MAALFGRDIKTMGKPIAHIFATTTADGKTDQEGHANLDVMMFVGYWVKRL